MQNRLQPSLSLPRIKPSESANEPLASAKFKKLKINDLPPTIQKPNSQSLTKPKTDRSSSRISLTATEDLKNQRTQRANLNIVQKKMKQGTYDQAEQVGSDLTSLKKQVSDYITSINLKNIEITKMRKRIDDVRTEIAVLANDVGALAGLVNSKKQNYEKCKLRFEEGMFERSRMQLMVSDRKADNVIWGARIESKKLEALRLKKQLDVLHRHEIEVKDKENDAENQYAQLLSTIEIENSQIMRKLQEQEAKLTKLTETELNRDDRKKKLINISTAVVEEEKEKETRRYINSCLGYKVMARLLDEKMGKLVEGSEMITHYFRQATQSRGPFEPQEFSKKFFDLEPQREQISQTVKQLEAKQSDLETKLKALKIKAKEYKNEYESLGEQIEARMKAGDLMEKLALDASLTRTQDAEKTWEVISFWSEKYLRRMEEMLVRKKERTSTNASNKQRIGRILELLRNNLLNNQQEAQ